MTPADEILLRRALRLAMNGRGYVEPNPMVGCVLARDGRMIGEGWHSMFGSRHAEPTALADCRVRGIDPRGATAYVTLEPCCHLNKKTPPCAPLLIKNGIARVVIGCLDPNSDVNGNGVAMLRAAGIAVDAAPPAVEAEFRQLIAPFLKRTNGSGPYLTLKWAQDADGCVAGPLGVRTSISGPLANDAVHRLRGRCDAILIGINTAINDNPNLLPRGVEAPRIPVRVVLDTALRLGTQSQLVRTVQDGPLLVYSAAEWAYDRNRHRDKLTAAGVTVSDTLGTGPDDRLLVRDLVQDWALRGWTHLMAEVGPTLARSLLPVADRLWVIRSPARIGDDSAPIAAKVAKSYVQTGYLRLGVDTLTEYLNRDAASFVAAVPSADFELEAALQSDAPAAGVY